MFLSEAKILIGDDSILARRQLIDILTRLNALRYLEASDGQEAVDIYQREPADIVFLDIVMPVKDGIAAAREILAVNPSAVIIIVSSAATQEQLKNALEAGAKDFIQKPFSFSHIKRVTETYFDKQ